MPHPVTAAEYTAVLARSRLLPAGAAEAARAEWAGPDEDLPGFRKWLVHKKGLTEYQAALVGRGHADGFFVGGYVILDRLGRGQSAGVYKARDPKGRLAALKVLPGSKARDPATLARFQREGRLLLQLDHPNVVRAVEVGTAGGAHFIALEYLGGVDLRDVLARRGKLPPAEAVRLLGQALSGLEHLHARRMVHRDIKPANLMLVWPPEVHHDTTSSATLKILDIGIGREMLEEAPASVDLTREGAVLGTPDYTAPEQARDARAADHRSDLYGLGCVLYHCVAGKTPYDDKSVVGQMVQHATEPFPRLPAGCPPGLQAVADKLTAKSPADRFPDATAALQALRPLLAPPTPPPLRVLPPPDDAEASGVELLPPRDPATPRPLWELDRRDAMMLGAGAGGALAAVAGGAGLSALMRRAKRE